MPIRYFRTNPTTESRACQIWQILVGCATRRETITYQRLVEHLGHSQPKVLAKQLGRIMHFCSQHRLPPLTVLVVNKTSGKPGDGLELTADRAKLRERVFNHDWYGLMPPTEDDYRAAWAKASQ